MVALLCLPQSSRKVPCRCNETAISLKAGCQLFLRYITRTSALEMENFETAKARIIEVCPITLTLLDSIRKSRRNCCIWPQSC